MFVVGLSKMKSRDGHVKDSLDPERRRRNDSLPLFWLQTRAVLKEDGIADRQWMRRVASEVQKAVEVAPLRRAEGKQPRCR